MFCTNCGAANQDSKFCTQCGGDLTASEVTIRSTQGTAPAVAASLPAAAAQPALAPISAPTRSRAGLVWGLLGGGIAVLLILVALFGPASSPIPAAVEACGLEFSSYASVGDGGDSVVLDMEGEEDIFGLGYYDVMCVLGELDLPDSAESLMLSTSALDGRQTADWDNLSASWTYHPDDGLDVIVTVNR
jgi:hypothetical protein